MFEKMEDLQVKNHPFEVFLRPFKEYHVVNILLILGLL